MPEVYDDRVAGVKGKCLPAAWDSYRTDPLRPHRARLADSVIVPQIGAYPWSNAPSRQHSMTKRGQPAA